jgi:sporulation integral membrane protein YlbJ
MFSNPENVLKAALSGLNIWLWVVLPSLLPFFIINEVMTETGVIDLLSIPMHRIMRPIFRCPGQASFVWIMSMTSGYPVGAKLTASLLARGKVTLAEAQRMLSFCSTSGPLFMIGAIGTGMLGNSQAGSIIAASHYIASFLTGLLFRFYRYDKEKLSSQHMYKTGLISAYKQFWSSYQRNKSNIGEIFGQAVTKSMNSLLAIGGFIIFFSVITELMIFTGIISLVAQIIDQSMPSSGVIPDIVKGVSAGIIEITVGSHMLSEVSTSLTFKITAISFIIGWSGLSVHSQIVNILNRTQLSISVYLLSKLSHATLSAILAWHLTKFIPVSNEVFQASQQPFWATHLMDSMLLSIYSLIGLFAFSIALFIIYSILSGKQKKSE